MFDDFRRERAARRVKPGDGRPLKRFRWWQSFSRSLFYLRVESDGGEPITYAVDVRHGGDSSGEIRAHLYRNGTLHAESKMPAYFPVEGGTVEVVSTLFGLRRCHFVTADGAERQLLPDAHSAEGRRAALDRDRPTLSRVIGAVSVVALLGGVALFIPQFIETISEIPPVAERLGTFTSPVQFTVWQNVAVGLVTGAASAERALRLRYNWLLDAIAN